MNPNQEPNAPGQPAGPGERVNVADIYPVMPDSNSPVAATDAAAPIRQAAQTEHEKAQDPPKKPKNEGWKSIVSTIMLFLLAPIIALTLTAFAFQSYQVDGQSMEASLQNNDRLIVNKVPRTLSRITHHAYVPNRGDIIVFNQAGLFDAGNGQVKQLIKRVVGLPGEQIEVRDGSITIYNKAHPDGVDPDQLGIYTITAPTTPGDVPLRTLGKDEIFVSGDNRGNSEDSRYFGPINADRIVGKLSFRIFPLSKAEKF
jgi:signal peptidase I